MISYIVERHIFNYDQALKFLKLPKNSNPKKIIIEKLESLGLEETEDFTLPGQEIIFWIPADEGEHREDYLTKLKDYNIYEFEKSENL